MLSNVGSNYQLKGLWEQVPPHKQKECHAIDVEPGSHVRGIESTMEGNFRASTR